MVECLPPYLFRPYLEIFYYHQQDAAQWFFSQPYIDESRIGAVGLCFGGCLSLMLAAYIPQVSVSSRPYSGPLITLIF